MKRIFVFVAVAALALSGCVKENYGARYDYDGIKFSATKVETKTVYDDFDDLQINWVDGDKISIWCDEAEDAKKADYVVVPSAEKKHQGKLGLLSSTSLKWGGDEGVHNFFAVYPMSSAIDVNDGIATCKVNANQVCTVNSSKSTSTEVIADPDMTNAYMVAHLSTEPVDLVDLHFRPIMTTLKITISGKDDVTQAASTITGVSIISQTNCYSDSFDYDMASGNVIVDDKTPVKTVTTFVGVKNGDEAYFDLAPKKTLTLTAFIPPVAINATNPVQVRLHAQHSGELKVTIKTEVVPSSKRKVVLPAVPSTAVKGNNWITPLDDDIYVSQLSIPGTHDAAAYGTTMFDAGQTQEKTIKQQLEMGIRAFDMRTAWRDNILLESRYNLFWMYHGGTQCEISLKSALQDMQAFLAENPGEFIFLQFRHESEKIVNPEKNTGKWNRIYNETDGPRAFKAADGSCIVVPFKNDLTVGECRGHIICVSRTYDAAMAGSGFGLVTDFPDNTSGTAKIDGAPYYVQDYFKYNSNDNGKEKIKQVKTLMVTTSDFHNPNRQYAGQWALNHTSAYAYWGVSLGTTQQYQRNANLVHREIFNYLTGKEKPVGSTGIVFSDWVGERRADSYTVYGDLLPQAIIDNNYKYHMLRKQN